MSTERSAAWLHMSVVRIAIKGVQKHAERLAPTCVHLPSEARPKLVGVPSTPRFLPAPLPRRSCGWDEMTFCWHMNADPRAS